jgi:hypothetical protein
LSLQHTPNSRLPDATHGWLISSPVTKTVQRIRWLKEMCTQPQSAVSLTL